VDEYIYYTYKYKEIDMYLTTGADQFIMGVATSVAGFLTLTIIISIGVIVWRWLKN
jgi:hypothetical protein